MLTFGHTLTLNFNLLPNMLPFHCKFLLKRPRVNKNPKLDAKCKPVLEILKFGYGLTSNFSSLSDMLPLSFRFLLDRPRVKIKYK